MCIEMFKFTMFNKMVLSWQKIITLQMWVRCLPRPLYKTAKRLRRMGGCLITEKSFYKSSSKRRCSNMTELFQGLVFFLLATILRR